MNAAITSIAYAVGEDKLTSFELAQRFGEETIKKIEKISGILERRIAAKGVCASDLGVSAANLIFEKNFANPEDIDLLVFATQTPDYIMPSNACILQDRLGLRKSCAAFDINLGCSQFPYALATAASWVNSKLAKKVLVITADTPSKLIHPLDKSAVSLFGDAAAAFIVENSTKKSLIDFEFGTDGSGFENLICPTSGIRNPPTQADKIPIVDEDGNTRANVNMRVNGFGIFAFAYKTIPEIISKLLNRNGMNINDIDLFVFHQAGEMMVMSAAKRLKIPSSKIYFKMHDIGNCGGASVPIALADAVENGVLKSGMRVVVCAFGVGLSWGASIINWSKDFMGATTQADFSNSPTKPISQRDADNHKD